MSTYYNRGLIVSGVDRVTGPGQNRLGWSGHNILWPDCVSEAWYGSKISLEILFVCWPVCCTVIEAQAPGLGVVTRKLEHPPNQAMLEQ